MARITLEGNRDKFIIETDIGNIDFEQRNAVERHHSITGAVLEVARGPNELIITIKSPYTLREEIKSSEQPGQLEQRLKMKFIANDSKRT